MEAAQPRRKRGRRPLGLDATSSCHSRNHPTYVSIIVSGCIIFSFAALLIKYSYAFAVMLSGVGTLDELFEALALIRTRRSNIFRCDHRNRLLAATDRFH